MKKSSFVEGTIIATVAIVLTKIMGMLYVIPFYSMIGTQGSALYAYAYNIYVIFLDISSAGLPIAISKLIKEYNTLGMIEAKQRTYKLGRNLISAISVIIFIILFVFAGSLASFLLGDLSGGSTPEDVTFVIRCISFAILVIPYLSVSKGYLQGHNIIGVSSASQIIEQVVRIAIILCGSYLCLYVFNLSVRDAVGVRVYAAFVAGLCAVVYIIFKLRKNKDKLGIKTFEKRDKVTNKEIIKKIAMYAIPFIIIDIAVSIYNLIDMVLIMRTLDFLNIPAVEVEYITTSITTWSNKLTMIVNSVAAGMSVSLIPSIVEAFTLKDWKSVNHKLNNALQIILVISIPMCIGISLLAKPIWSIFYGYNDVGSSILAIQIFISLFFNLYTVTSSTLQSLNKFKFVYISTLSGFLLNAILDVPFMLLFNKLGLPIHFGAIVATGLGYFLSVCLALFILRKQHKLNYKATLQTLLKQIVPIIAMVIVVLICKAIIPVNLESKISCIIYVAIISCVGALIYLLMVLKNNTLYDAFGKENVQRIIKKLTFGKISLN